MNNILLLLVYTYTWGKIRYNTKKQATKTFQQEYFWSLLKQKYSFWKSWMLVFVFCKSVPWPGGAAGGAGVRGLPEGRGVHLRHRGDHHRVQGHHQEGHKESRKKNFWRLNESPINHFLRKHLTTFFRILGGYTTSFLFGFKGSRPTKSKLKRTYEIFFSRPLSFQFLLRVGPNRSFYSNFELQDQYPA